MIAYHPDDYAFLAKHVTAARVKEHFADIVRGSVERYKVPALPALKFVMNHALGGGVSRTLNLDIHGKSLSSSLLELPEPSAETQETVSEASQVDASRRRRARRHRQQR